MHRLVVIAVSLSVSLASLAAVALAQDKGSVQSIYTNADGSDVTSTDGVNPTADGEGGTIIYGDIYAGPESTVITPPSVVQSAPPPAPAPAPEPVAEPAPETVADPAVAATTETAPAESAAPVGDTAVATDTDLDADNYPDALEWDLGLDPNNIDTDADGVADGDEINIYATDPILADSDGDGVIDGAELYDTRTDPLLWDDFSASSGEAVAQDVAEPVQTFQQSPDEVVPLGQETTEDLSATDGDAAALGKGNASAAPGTVRRGGRSGMSLLGPDGTYSVTEVSPPNVSVAGDTEVLAPPAEAAPAPEAAPAETTTIAGCDSYGNWYDAQVAYEAAGMTAADPALVEAVDPDYDGIACEEAMT